MSRAKSERLINLTIALMATSRYVTVEEIARLVSGYEPAGGDVTDAAFRRMFERDKEELRDLGIPIETGTVDPLHGDDIGYRIRRDSYALPPLALDAEERAALGLAARFWSSAEQASDTASGMRKLAAGGVDAVVPEGFEAHVDAADPAFGPLTAAVRDRRAVTFDYRTPDGTASTRRLEPWGVVSRRKHWYVVGFDRDREAERVFRLSRITSPVTLDGPSAAYAIPDGVDLRAAVSEAFRPEPDSIATLRLAEGAGTRLRRRGTLDTSGDGDLLTLAYAGDVELAEELLGYGPGVVVIDPPSLRAAVVERLRVLAS